MGNYLFNQQSLDTARLLGETGGVDHDEATIVTDIDNYGGNTLGRDGFNIALGNDGTLEGDTVRAQVNIKLKNFIKYLGKKLSIRFFSRDLLFAELSNPADQADARLNLNVMSTEETATAVGAAVAADTSTLKTANRLSEFENLGQGLEDIYDHLIIYSRSGVAAYVGTTCDTKAEVTAKIAADTTHFKVWSTPTDMFKELNDVYKKDGARVNLDVYSRSQSHDDIINTCYTKATTVSLIAAAIRKKYHYAQNIGGASFESPVTIDGYTYNYWAISTSNTANRYIKLPSLEDCPNLLPGDELTVKSLDTSEHDLFITYFNSDILPSGDYMLTLSKRDCAHFTWGGTAWELNNYSNN
jgi:hypothetical protein